VIVDSYDSNGSPVVSAEMYWTHGQSFVILTIKAESFYVWAQFTTLRKS